MTLTTLYGSGALAGFTAACRFPLLNYSDPIIVQADTPTGSVRVNVAWDHPDGRAEMKIECWPERVHYLTLRSGADHPTGLYTALCEALPDYFRNRGVLTFTASPRDVDGEAILRSRGAWDAAMRWRI